VTAFRTRLDELIEGIRGDAIRAQRSAAAAFHEDTSRSRYLVKYYAANARELTTFWLKLSSIRATL
jgi:hypothetical protein